MKTVRVESDGTPNGTLVKDAETGKVIPGVGGLKIEVTAGEPIQAVLNLVLPELSMKLKAKIVEAEQFVDDGGDLWIRASAIASQIRNGKRILHPKLDQEDEFTWQQEFTEELLEAWETKQHPARRNGHVPKNDANL